MPVPDVEFHAEFLAADELDDDRDTDAVVFAMTQDPEQTLEKMSRSMLHTMMGRSGKTSLVHKEPEDRKIFLRYLKRAINDGQNHMVLKADPRDPGSYKAVGWCLFCNKIVEHPDIFIKHIDKHTRDEKAAGRPFFEASEDMQLLLKHINMMKQKQR